MKRNDITFNVGVSISEDTIARCCLLFGMYLTDHPELELNTSINNTSDGERYVTVYTTRKEESEV